MPRIAILHPDLGIGGAERLIVDIALALKSSGHDVDLYTNFHDPRRCFDETRNGQLNVIVACSWFPRQIFGRFYALCAYVRFILLAFYVVFFSAKEKHYDLYLCDQISASIPVLRRAARPVLFYCHYPDQLLTQRETLLKKFYRWPIDAIEVSTTCLADRILVNSDFTRSVFRKHISAEIPVEILYPTIPDAGAPLESTNEERTVNFLSINRFERKKDLGLALRAFARLNELLSGEHRPIHLDVIGGYDPRLRENVDYYDELNALLDSLPLDRSSVTFVRSFSDGEKRDFLAKAHCVLYTPRFEHFGIVPLEAMQAGRPVIATATGGPLETIVDGRTGYLCAEPLVENFAKRMKEVVENPQRAKQMGAEGRRRVEENFAFQPFAQKLNEHVEDLLRRPTNRHPLFSLFLLFSCSLFFLLMVWFFF